MARARDPITGKLRNASPKPPDLRAIDVPVPDEPVAVRIETNYRWRGNIGDGNRWVRPPSSE